MSALIESAARGAKSMFPGVGEKSKMDAAYRSRGHDLIRQLALGGAAIGGGTGLAVVLANYLKSLRQEAEVEDVDRLNDDTLYIPVNKQAAEGVNPWLAPGVAVTGGILSAGGAYALTRMLYAAMEKKRRQKMLDEAQNEALVAADIEASKQASTSLTFADLATAFPVAVPLLAALASGGVAYAALDKTFPVVDKPKSKYPKRIRAVAPGGQVTDADIPEQKTKEAALSDQAIEASAAEFLMLFVDRVSSVRKSASSLTSELLSKVAKHGISEIRTMCCDIGLPAVVEAIKGAECSDELAKLAAASVIARDPLMGPVAQTLAASEFIELMPTIAGICSQMDRDSLDKAAALGVLMHETVFRDDILEKAAAAANFAELPPELMDDLMLALQQQQQMAPGGHTDEESDAAMTTDLSGSMAEDAEGDQTTAPRSAAEESTGKDDLIDRFMEQPAAM